MADFSTKRTRLIFVLERKEVYAIKNEDGLYLGYGKPDREALATFAGIHGPFSANAFTWVAAHLKDYDLELVVR